jgi:hypothetical protein
MIQTRTIANDVLVQEFSRLIQDGNEVIFQPKGFSMLPFIVEGKDSVLMKAPGELAEYDIILAKTTDGRYVIHRIEGIEADLITLRGDGNINICEKCTRDNVIAVVAKIIKPRREIDCHSSSHLMAAKIWRRLLPLRRYLLAIYRRIIL